MTRYNACIIFGGAGHGQGEGDGGFMSNSSEAQGKHAPSPAGGALPKEPATAFAVFGAYVLSNWLLTSKVFPIGTDVAPLCRDIATLVEAVGFLAVALVASRAPRLLGARSFLIAPLALSLVGGIGLWAFAPASPLAATLALCLLLLGSVFVMLSAGCCLACLTRSQMAKCVLLGLFASYILRFPLSALSPQAALVLFVALQILAVLVGRADTGKALEIIQSGQAPDELTLTNPFSFLPRSHRLFVCLALFQTAYGAALSFGEVNNAPLATWAGIVPLLFFLAIWAVSSRPLLLDSFFNLALLLLMAGFLFAPISQQAVPSLTSNLIEAGKTCFWLVFWPALAALSARNRAGTLPLFAWSGFLLCVGVTGGAELGRLCYAAMAGSFIASTAVTGAVVLCLAAFALFGMRGFSYDTTVEALTASPEVVEHEPTPDLDTTVARLIDTTGLTAREAEIFALLAQGRNGAYIQRQLGVSYNTVKTHVAHIYTKLGVHSHQELIDLVEGA